MINSDYGDVWYPKEIVDAANRDTKIMLSIFGVVMTITIIGAIL